MEEHTGENGLKMDTPVEAVLNDQVAETPKTVPKKSTNPYHDNHTHSKKKAAAKKAESPDIWGEKYTDIFEKKHQTQGYLSEPVAQKPQGEQSQGYLASAPTQAPA